MNAIDYWYQKYMALKKVERIPKPELTWEDVNLIDSILIDMQDEGVEKYGGLKQYYEEALKRFKEARK